MSYIPVEDELGEQVKKSMGQAKNFKSKLSNETGVPQKCWDGGSSEDFLVHVISVLATVTVSITSPRYEKTEKTEKAHQEVADEIKLCKDSLAIADPPSEDEVEISCKQENSIIPI